MSLQHQIDEQRIVATDLGHVDVTIVDGMFFFHLLKDPPMLLGDISMFILRKVCKIDSNEIYLAFDRIVKPSIKDCERDSRSGIADRTESYVIVGPSQKRPNDFGAALRNDNFKTSFLKYLFTS